MDTKQETTTSNLDKIPQRSFGEICGNVRLPRKVSIVGLGCSSFSAFFFSKEELSEGDWVPEKLQKTHPRVKEWIRTIEYAIMEAKITLLDTAPWYGHGTSEMVIGWAIEHLGNRFHRGDVTINTKVGRYEADPEYMFDFSSYTTMQSVMRSLKRMNIEYIDVLQLHDPEFSPSLDLLLNETIPALLLCQERKWCRAIGLTGYPLQVQHQILESTMKHFGRNIWDQAMTYGHYNLHNFSLIDRPLPGIDSSYAEYCLQNKIMIVAAAPLSMGLLTNNEVPEWHPASEELKDACRQAAKICREMGVNIADLALVLAMANPKLPCTVLGMRDVKEVKNAQSVACRFQNVSSDLTTEEVLDLILSECEKRSWKELSDPEHGPFANVWKSGAFQWDGVTEAQNFWTELGRDVNWQRMAK